jgi:predicted RNase H-like nuclease (RuvC/YqgF family)
VQQVQRDSTQASVSEPLEQLTGNIRENLEQIEIQVCCHPYQQRLEELLRSPPESDAEAEQLSQQLRRLLDEIEADIGRRKKAPSNSRLQELAREIRKLIEQAESAKAQLAAQAILGPLFKEYENLMSRRPSGLEDLYELQSGLTDLLMKLGKATRNPACAPAAAQVDRLRKHVLDNLDQINRLKAQRQ